MRMDHYEIFASVLPVVGEIPDVDFVSCEITDNRMYIKAVNPHLTAQITSVLTADYKALSMVLNFKPHKKPIKF